VDPQTDPQPSPDSTVEQPAKAGFLADTVEEPVLGWLAREGYEPEYGARPLRRLLRRRIENPLATALLEERFQGAAAVQVSLAVGGDQLAFAPLPALA